ncbi:MAG: TIGR03936 family radical SAM-associated protein [Thermoleophilia bacterium]
MRFNYQMRFAKTGRARFISHLDTLSCLTRAVRRTGCAMAFTEGMRPKPILSLAMPLGVGVEGEDEICDFSLQERASLPELAKKLSRELPEGMELTSLGPTYERTKAASRVGGVSYRIELAEPRDAYEKAVVEYNAADSLVILRQRPKGDKEVDIKKYVPVVGLDPQDRGIVFDMEVTGAGTGRPEEVTGALAGFAGAPLTTTRMVRMGITITQEPPPGKSTGRGKPYPRRNRR